MQPILDSANPLIKQPILALDVGEARIGLAISDELQMFAHPLQAISVKSVKAARKDLLELINDKKISEVIIGLPRNSAGQIGEQARKTIHFALTLRQDLTLKGLSTIRFFFWDERFSSIEASAINNKNRAKQKVAKSKIDEISAALILESYLNSLHR